MRRSSIRILAAALLCATALVSMLAETAPLQVTYYYLPGWGICQRMKPAVSGLEQEYKGKVRAENLDATTPENQKIVKSLGFDNHGLVIRDAGGKVLWKQADHGVKIDDVRKALDKLLTR